MDLDKCITESAYEQNSIRSMLRHRDKKAKTFHLKPIVFGYLRMNLGIPKVQVIRILMDTGSDGTILFKDLGKKLRIRREKGCEWKTAEENFKLTRNVRYNSNYQSSLSQTLLSVMYI